MQEKGVETKMDRNDEQPSPCAEHSFESAGDLLRTSLKWEEFIKELKMQWKKMWCERFNDKVRAEGIAIGDYPFLFLERGTVVIAIRRYRVPDFLRFWSIIADLWKLRKLLSILILLLADGENLLRVF